jgi:hypothetical protein
MKRFTMLFALVLSLGLSACTENYANGERIGLVTQFSEAGFFWKSWEGHLNLTQTGMNSSSAYPFDFSIDNDKPDSIVINTLKAAADSGWKVKLTYHETSGYNWVNNRGETNHFITKVEVLDKNVTGFLHAPSTTTPTVFSGKVVDTIYVVIVGRSSEKK